MNSNNNNRINSGSITNNHSQPSRQNLEAINEEQFEESSLHNFALESMRVSQRFSQADHLPIDASVDLKSFPNCDFYYKLVAKVNGKYYSIYDGDTEYVIGQQKFQEVKHAHQGGYYVYGSLKEAIFADIPYNKGGHYIAPRTVIKCICWGSFIVYDKGKLAFSYLLPVADLGLPIGYKNSKESVKTAVKEQEVRKHRALEHKYNKYLVKKSLKQGYDGDKFENYFGPKAVEKLEQQLEGGVIAKKQPKKIDPKISDQIQLGLEKMIADIESRYQ